MSIDEANNASKSRDLISFNQGKNSHAKAADETSACTTSLAGSFLCLGEHDELSVLKPPFNSGSRDLIESVVCVD